ncbi:hypothetical protein TIFTF001_018841 [Ficus carica]|uniref:Uncharacterized protein n=1 Tax=Ficus carica TaxID=3494 RepID=A0AA88AP13_FICCA|nr:hypothetical protein TIFTF001_018841 [Ficus carica]
MKDMKAGFNLTNPTVIEVDWSFVPEISGKTATEEGQASSEEPEEGEVTGGTHIAENVVVLDEQEAEGDQAGDEAVLPDQQT